jgi:hypothetical protein
MNSISLSIIGAIIIGLLAALPLYVYGTADKASCTIVDKERVVTNETSRYLIFCETEVFENTDSLLRLKFRSSDFYGALKIGEMYELSVYGWRVPFLSMYRNIYDYKPLD